MGWSLSGLLTYWCIGSNGDQKVGWFLRGFLFAQKLVPDSFDQRPHLVTGNSGFAEPVELGYVQV
ncbi:hypothetical protein ACFWCQ_10835, partial [Streptomyces cyaneofuscatus]|uniref:hypothetical protein n=1 Tax=Streptomyces cyaneofuscatus TaxID=66883 RepID=UPI00364D38D2